MTAFVASAKRMVRYAVAESRLAPRKGRAQWLLAAPVAYAAISCCHLLYEPYLKAFLLRPDNSAPFISGFSVALFLAFLGSLVAASGSMTAYRDPTLAALLIELPLSSREKFFSKALATSLGFLAFNAALMALAIAALTWVAGFIPGATWRPGMEFPTKWNSIGAPYFAGWYLWFHAMALYGATSGKNITVGVMIVAVFLSPFLFLFLPFKWWAGWVFLAIVILPFTFPAVYFLAYRAFRSREARL